MTLRNTFWAKCDCKLLLLAATIGYVIFKFPDLLLPYFWDELGVYSAGAVYQVHHGISLIPAGMPVDYSRGHPLLLYALYATVLKLFGTKVVVAHAFALIITIVFLWALFIVLNGYFGGMVALLATLLFAVQSVTLAQSALVLPEMPMAFLTFIAIYFFVTKKWAGYIVAASIAFLIKETAIVIVATAMVLLLIQLILKRENPSKTLKLSAIILLPLLPYVAFLILQKLQQGWFFFPYHLHLVSFKWDDIQNNYLCYEHFIFFEQGRTCWTFTDVAAIVFIIYKGVKHKLSIGAFVKTQQFLFLLAMVLIMAFTFGYCLVFAQLMRYSLMLMAPFAILTLYAVYYITNKKLLVFMPLCIVLLAVPFFYLSNGAFNYDADMGYKNEIKQVQQTANFCETLNIYDKKIATAFPYYYALSDTNEGYIKRKNFTVTSDMHFADYVVFTDFPPLMNVWEIKKYKTDTLAIIKSQFSTTWILKVVK